MLNRLIIFSILNFAALGLGGLLAGKGATSIWYASLSKAPWTPPGWVFGVTWVLIMVCFSFYLAYLWPLTENKSTLIGLLIIQYALNIAWNPAFFRYHNIAIGLIIILMLTLLVGYIQLLYWSNLKTKSLLLLPYFIWLIIATSLNAYAFIKN
ncbi:TspO/MBR family protein [Frigoriflavimonas asaccharolytica]|uniref:Tryptophan-rich sensory protein n=1 Tax=Frigoriflavimonas asaccharolytica TaxID=2735899 RepID=A0A8J8G942_9FLAO|nr:TspO/MBR family protein [Frigoriflavimonas asaccharolytica]NRS93733.1 tryptophan-rich sensory protein [Frigoriflavimonas asaccharolytica]